MCLEVALWLSPPHLYTVHAQPRRAFSLAGLGSLVGTPTGFSTVRTGVSAGCVAVGDHAANRSARRRQIRRWASLEIAAKVGCRDLDLAVEGLSAADGRRPTT